MNKAKENCKICDGKGFIEKKYKTTMEKATGIDKQQCPHCRGFGFTIVPEIKTIINKLK